MYYVRDFRSLLRRQGPASPCTVTPRLIVAVSPFHTSGRHQPSFAKPWAAFRKTTGRACRSLAFFQGAGTAAGGHSLRGAGQRARACHCPGCHRGAGDAGRGTGFVLEDRGTVGRHTLTQGQGELRIGLISAKRRHSRPLSGCPADTAQAVTHPRHGRARPCLASAHAPTTGVNGSQQAPPPRQTDGQLDQSQRGMLPGGQSARP